MEIFEILHLNNKLNASRQKILLVISSRETMVPACYLDLSQKGKGHEMR